ncbi:Glutamate receptor ionotropic, delta-2 [Datura stramonium]|uniref:Glutamate receptor n=1 Tax=Datura stramonium TaxID=4076 RepID=A0ABS8TMS0_DATST|nr:Glutamate receptor ionotropic, delta-2 [Datura stramonium]
MNISFHSILVGLLITMSSSLCCSGASGGNNSVISFQVGVVLDLDTELGHRALNCLRIAHSDFYSRHPNYTTRLVLHVRDSKGNVIDATASGLELLKFVKVDAVIGPQKSTQANFMMNLGERAQVPIVSFSATSPSLQPRTKFFIQTAQTDDTEVGAIAAIVKTFQWNRVVIIYEDSDYGNGIVPYLSNALQYTNARIAYKSLIPVSAHEDFILKELYKMMTMQTRVFIVHVSHSLGAKLFLKAMEIGMMSEGYVWIVTSDLMDLLPSMNLHVVEAMQGVLGVKPLIPKTRNLELFRLQNIIFDLANPGYKPADIVSIFDVWAYDTMWALAMAAEQVGTHYPEASNQDTTADLNSSDLFNLPISKTGPKLLRAILMTRFKGLSGIFHLVDGKLYPTSYKILNVVGNGEKEVAVWTKSDGFKRVRHNTSDKFYSTSTEDFSSSIIWPGKSRAVPRGWEVPVRGKKLKVAVAVRPGFEKYLNVMRDSRTDAVHFSGYYIEVFKSVIAALPYAVPYDFFHFEKPDGSCAGSYNDLIYQVFLQNYDAAIGDITITGNRSNYVDFTLPFAEGGVVRIVPITYEDDNDMWTFLKPMKKELWLTSIAFFFVTGLAVWILEHRISSSFRGPPSHHLGMIFYFPFSTFVFAHRERIVSNLTRLVVVVWMFVVLILNSTYTASLSSRLTVQRLRPAIADVKELIRKGHSVGCYQGSFVCDILRGMGFEELKIKMYRLPEEYKEALSYGSKSDSISAFFDVVPYSKLFLSKYCDKYTIVGPTYHTDGFAFVFPKGSPLVADVSRAVIKLTEIGEMLDIQQEWSISDPTCNGPDSIVTSVSVSLQSFKGLFAITGTITSSCVLIFIVSYVYKNRSSLQQILNSRSTVWSKIKEIARHFDQRDLSSHPSIMARDPQFKYPKAEVAETVSSSQSVDLSNSNLMVLSLPMNILSTHSNNIAVPNIPTDSTFSSSTALAPVSSEESTPPLMPLTGDNSNAQLES